MHKSLMTTLLACIFFYTISALQAGEGPTTHKTDGSPSTQPRVPVDVTLYTAETVVRVDRQAVDLAPVHFLLELRNQSGEEFRIFSPTFLAVTRAKLGEPDTTKLQLPNEIVLVLHFKMDPDEPVFMSGDLNQPFVKLSLEPLETEYVKVAVPRCMFYSGFAEVQAAFYEGNRLLGRSKTIRMLIVEEKPGEED